MLQIILPEIILQVVYLDGGEQRGEREDGRAVTNRAVGVERALRVHQQHRHLPARTGSYRQRRR